MYLEQLKPAGALYYCDIFRAINDKWSDTGTVMCLDNDHHQSVREDSLCLFHSCIFLFSCRPRLTMFCTTFPLIRSALGVFLCEYAVLRYGLGGDFEHSPNPDMSNKMATSRSHMFYLNRRAISLYINPLGRVTGDA